MKMAPSKDWMAIEDYVNDPSYEEGVDNFLDYAFQNVKTHTIRCPCYKCINGESGDREKVKEHLLVYGIVKWAHQEASIAECYLSEECMNLCSSHYGRAFGAATVRELEKSELDEAHIYILKNCDEVQPLIQEYAEVHKSMDHRITEEEWCENFKIWFKNKLKKLWHTSTAPSKAGVLFSELNTLLIDYEPYKGLLNPMTFCCCSLVAGLFVATDAFGCCCSVVGGDVVFPDVFTNESIDAYKEHVLNHMRELWTNWRSDLLRCNVTKKKITLAATYKGKPPNGVEENDWKWLIKEVYLDDDFQKRSIRNSENRANYPKELMH
uniref:Transposase-associated domain-containing protein n=1 Tax=Chenopodium quinoa TaxID=63459 RepID=A0A803M6K8_CHEQI